MVSSTYHNLYMDARAVLRERDEHAASLEARFMLMAASGKTHEQLLRDAMLYVPADIRSRFHDMLNSRLSGNPLAYVIGSWNFYGLTITVTPDVLIPRVDTEVLAQAAIEHARGMETGVRVLDLCTGSGCVALAIASNVPNAHVTMLDVSEAALHIAKRNARDLKLFVSAIAADILEPPPAAIGQYDIITCNPPYIPAGDCDTLDAGVRGYEPRLALDGGPDGMDFYRALARLWRTALKPGGRFFVELGVGACRVVREIFLLAGFTGFKVLTDTGGIERVLIASNTP